MAEVKLDVEIGDLKFRAKGPERWVEARLNQMLGLDAAPATPKVKAKAATGKGRAAKGPNAKSSQWMGHYGVTTAMLDQVFHRDGDGYEVIARTLGGKSKAAKTVNAYLLMGIATLLGSGEVKFGDEPARSLCGDHACYDPANHAKNLKAKGNWIRGGARNGWSLTKPGLEAAADLVKALTGSTEK